MKDAFVAARDRLERIFRPGSRANSFTNYPTTLHHAESRDTLPGYTPGKEPVEWAVLAQNALSEKQKRLDERERALDERERALGKRASSDKQKRLDEREQALSDKQIRLDERERASVERETALEKLRVHLDNRDKFDYAWTNTMNRWCSRVGGWEDVLSKASVILDIERTRVRKEREKALTEREQFLAKQEGLFMEREKAFKE